MPEATAEAEQEITPGAQAAPETAKPEQGTLRRTFQRESGRFFKIDLDPMTTAPAETGITGIVNDPSFVNQLWDKPHIYYDDLNSEIFTPQLRAQMRAVTPTPAEGASWESHYRANRENLRETLIETGEMFMENLRETSPELHALIERDIQQSLRPLGSPTLPTVQEITDALDPEEKLALERMRAANRMTSNYFVNTLYANEALISLTESPAMPSPEELEEAAFAYRESKTVMAFLPGENFSLMGNTEIHRSLQQAKNPPPGTNAEWAAVVTAHETEHLIDAAKDRDPKILPPEMRAVIELTNETMSMMGPLQETLSHLREIEADLSAVQAVYGQVTPEILPYWGAVRIGDSMINTMPQLLREKIPENENINLVPPAVRDNHDTGYFIAEYLETGNIAEYFETKSAMDGFYGKTADQYIAAAQAPLKEAGLPQTTLRTLTPSLSDTVDLVQRTLAQDPPVYTPAEAQIAQKFVEGMTEQLGIERGNIAQGLTNSISALPKQPETTPAPAAAPAVN